jgi:hypothetical protein
MLPTILGLGSASGKAEPLSAPRHLPDGCAVVDPGLRDNVVRVKGTQSPIGAGGGHTI